MNPDAAGNLQTTGIVPLVYDAEGHVASAGSETYVYDGDGERVARMTPSFGKYYRYNAHGLPENIQDDNFSWWNLGYFGGRLVNNVELVPIYDALGTARVTMDMNGHLLGDEDFFPFGGEVIPVNTYNPFKFTGKERDTESGLDLMGARYYASSMGRFMSPDPVFATVDRLMDPQQWNMYSYVRNNPLSNTDPTGLDFNITGCGDNTATCQNNTFGTTSTDANGKSSFTATVLSNGANGGLVDQAGNSYNGSFDQSGFHFSNSDGSVSGGGQFIHGSAETDVAGSGVFGGTEGHFNSDCGGSCRGKGSLTDNVPGSIQAAKDAFGLSKEDKFNIFGGHGKADNYRGPGEQDAHIVQHLAGRDAGRTELHFEGHPPGRDLVNFVLHQVDAIHDFATHESRKEPALP